MKRDPPLRSGSGPSRVEIQGVKNGETQGLTCCVPPRLGLAAPDVAAHAASVAAGAGGDGGPYRMGTCSWKAAVKGRPIPCDLLRSPALRDGNERGVVYWGPDAGPAGVSLVNHQSHVAKKQPRGENLMRRMISRFFQDVFDVTGDPSAWAAATRGDPALPWSNYFLAGPAVWNELAKFDVIASAWLDSAYPRSTAGNSSETSCPANYDDLHKQGVLAKVDVEPNCHYCRTAEWTNWHRCHVGCHRCWSYVLEQINVIYFRVLTDLTYVHDAAACDAGGTKWPPPQVLGRGDFDSDFIRDLYDAIVPPPLPLADDPSSPATPDVPMAALCDADCYRCTNAQCVLAGDSGMTRAQCGAWCS